MGQAGTARCVFDAARPAGVTSGEHARVPAAKAGWIAGIVVRYFCSPEIGLIATATASG